MADPHQELVAGNVYDKENTRNPVARWLIRKFDLTLLSLVEQVQPKSILEVGCGDGLVLSKLRSEFPEVGLVGLDLSLAMARKVKYERGIKLVACASAESLPCPPASFDLVICAEVLEHLHHPRGALREAKRVAREHVLVSVPNEPIWRVMNMLRGAYWRHLGNTPGHFQHWRPHEFLEMLREDLSILRVEKPFPWVMTLCNTEKTTSPHWNRVPGSARRQVDEPAEESARDAGERSRKEAAPIVRDRPFFIVGCGRSGTSLLRGLLNGHPEVAIPLESLFIPDFLRKADELTTDRLRSMIVREPELREWGLQVDSSDLRDCQTVGDMVAQLHVQYAGEQGKRRWGNKTPRFVRWLDLLHLHFPEAYFIHVVRDPRAVASSLIRSDVHRSTALHAARRWQRDVAAGLEFERAAPSFSLRVRYEDLARAPGEVLAEVCQFLGLEYEPDQMGAGLGMGEYSVFYENIHANLRTGVTDKYVSRWKDDLEEVELRIVEAICAPLMSELGYQLVGAGRAAPRGAIRSMKVRRLFNLGLQAWRYLRYRPGYLIHLLLRKWRLGLLGEFLRAANY